MGNHDKKVGDYVGKCSGQTHKQTNSHFINIDSHKGERKHGFPKSHIFR